MRGKSIGKEWYKNDKSNGNKLRIFIKSDNLRGYEKEIQHIYYTINSIKPNYLEYIYIHYDNSSYDLIVKFKDKIIPEHKAKLRKYLYEWNKSDLNTVSSIITPIKEEVENLARKGNIRLIKGPAFIKDLDVDMTNTDDVKKYIKEIRYENHWDKPSRVNGADWPNCDPTEEIPRPSGKHLYTVYDMLRVDELNRFK